MKSKRKPLSDLIADIYSVLEDGREVPEALATEFGVDLANVIRDRVQEALQPPREFTLRMSNIGKGTRQLWYDKQYGKAEKFSGATLLKFLYGDLVERIVLWLASLSGHDVTQLQAEVVLGGVKGHIDADIDGVTVDVKSASPHAFRKFKNGTLKEDDAFGYVEQITGYCKARGTSGAFLAVDKSSGDLAYLPVTEEEIKGTDVEARIEYLKVALESDVVPERCYPDEDEGASGNRKLGVNCSYCAHKGRCWADANGGLGLRTFLYSSGPKFLTKVTREPQVREVTF